MYEYHDIRTKEDAQQLLEQFDNFSGASGRLAQPCFWHFGGQRALDHLLGWEREGSTNCTLET